MLSLRAFGGWVFVVADGSGASTIVTRTRARKPLLGRMSVFIIGILVGVALGVVITVMGAPLLDELYPSAFASAPATPSPAAAKPAPPAAAGLAALFAPPAAKAAPDAAKADASPSTPSQLAAASHGGILILHDSHMRTAMALDDLITTFEQEGYRFVQLVPAPEAQAQADLEHGGPILGATASAAPRDASEPAPGHGGLMAQVLAQLKVWAENLAVFGHWLGAQLGRLWAQGLAHLRH